MELDEETQGNLVTTLQKNLVKEERKNKKLKQEVEILKTQNNFLDSQLEYSEKKYQKKDLMLKGLKNRVAKLEKELGETRRERDDLLVQKMANASQVSKEIYETGGQSANMDAAIEKGRAIKDRKLEVRCSNQRTASYL